MTGRPATGRGAWVDRVLTLLAAGYFVLVAVWNFGSSVHSSAKDVADGRLWLLLTSALDVDGALPVLQVVLVGVVATFVIAREGPRVWWLAVLCAHVVSALFAYGVIGVAAGLGSDAAERVADDPDYGVSCVLAGSVGAMFASGLLARRRPRTDVLRGRAPHRFALGPSADRVAVVGGAVGFLGLLTIAFGWYDMEHPIAFALGAGVVWLTHRGDGVENTQHPASPSV